MGRQQGVVTISGKVGNLIFSTRKGKRHVKKKSEKPMDQTERTKKSSIDFGMASKMGARIRKAFAPTIALYGDITLVSRVTKRILAILKTIENPILGEKSIAQGDIGLLEEFEFNAAAKLDYLLRQLPEVTLVGTGLSIIFAKNTDSPYFKPPPTANAVVLQLRVYNLALSEGDDEVIPVKDLLIKLHKDFKGAKLQIPLDFKGERAGFAALGIFFLKDGIIRDKTKRAAAMVYAAKVVDGREVMFLPTEVQKPYCRPEATNFEWEVED